MTIHNLRDNRHLCWDDMLIEKQENTEIRMHKPEKKNIAFHAEKSWDGMNNGYASIQKCGNEYRFYYRADSSVLNADGKYQRSVAPMFCMATSKDAITFKRPKLGLYDINGTENNVIHFENKYVDNFSIFYDENPDCPPDEKFKALKLAPVNDEAKLLLHTSPDGIHFTKEGRILDLHGDFDSYNVMLWDKETEQYFVFYRGVHPPKYSEYKNKAKDIYKMDGDADEIRDIRVATSKDFIHFEEHGQINFIDDTIEEDIQYYTNQIIKYPRAKDMFLAMPTRYIDRRADVENYKDMPLWGHRNVWIENYGREGLAITDSILMTSRDGFNFNRTDEAFFTPGPESDASWWYGDCFWAYGMEETESDIHGAPNELSLYVGEGYHVQPVNFRRYTMRLDGFFSWYAKYKGGEILTKPFTFEGNELEINFSTAAYGGMKITLCDEAGSELEGYKSIFLFGDSVDRKVKFEKPLSALNGKAVRMKIELRDAHLYSFKFN